MVTYEAVLCDPYSGETWREYTKAKSASKARSNMAWRIRRSPRVIHIASIKEAN